MARRQHGRASRKQVLEAGISSSAIGRLVASGWLRTEHLGVYALAGAQRTAEGRWMAAVLAGGPDSLPDDRSAGELWGLVDPIDGPVHVSVTSGGRARSGLIFHRRATHEGIRAVRSGIPVVSVETALLKLASSLGPSALRHCLEAAERKELLNIPRLSRLLDGAGGRKGVGTLRALVAEYRPSTDSKSELEREFQRFCRRWKILPPPNVPVGEFIVDAYWPAAQLVIELDSYAFHRSPAQFEADRRRDIALRLAEEQVLRVTDRRLRTDAARLAGEILTALALGSASKA